VADTKSIDEMKNAPANEFSSMKVLEDVGHLQPS